MSRAALFRDLLIRDIRGRFIGSYTGWLWLVVTPLLLLCVYAFVFGVIFRARVPEGLELPFIAWLAVALWPWLAFSDGLLRASESIPRHSALISKVALPRELLTQSTTTATFVLQMVGYAVVLAAIELFTTGLTWSGLPRALLVLGLLYVLASGLGLLLAAVRVFVRDLEHLLPTLLILWFFLTPILYHPDMLPDLMAEWLFLNPMSWVMSEIRAGLLFGEPVPGPDMLLAAILVAGVYFVGRTVFRRLSPHFEDFL